MNKYFNTAGPCNNENHYMLPTLDRCKGLMSLIIQKQYFVIYSARQSGKTTILLDLTKQLNNKGDYYTLYCTLESTQKIDDPKEGIPAIIKLLKRMINRDPLLNKFSFAQNIDYKDYTNILSQSLGEFCSIIDKPLVILFHEMGTYYRTINFVLPDFRYNMS